MPTDQPKKTLRRRFDRDGVERREYEVDTGATSATICVSGDPGQDDQRIKATLAMIAEDDARPPVSPREVARR